MHRWRYLTIAGSATGMAILAGCLDDVSEMTDSESDDEGGGDDEAGTDDSSASGDGDESDDSGGSTEVDREIRTAAGRLNRSGASLRESQGTLEDPEATEYDPAEPREFLEEGLEALEAAEEYGPSEDEQADIDELYAFADVLGPTIDVTETVTDDTLEEEVDAINEAAIDEDLDGAASKAEALDERFTAAKADLEPAVDGVDDLDAARLADRSVTELEDVQAGVETLFDVVVSVTTLTGATVEVVGGQQTLADGRDYLEAEAFDDAITAFEAAESTFLEATDALAEGGGEAPEGLEPYFDTALCQTGSFVDATGYFIEAVEAAQDEDPVAAEEAKEDAEAALEAAADCHESV